MVIGCIGLLAPPGVSVHGVSLLVHIRDLPKARTLKVQVPKCKASTQHDKYGSHLETLHALALGSLDPQGDSEADPQRYTPKIFMRGAARRRRDLALEGVG